MSSSPHTRPRSQATARAHLTHRQETGDVYAIDLGGTNFRCMHAKLGAGLSEVVRLSQAQSEITHNKLQRLANFQPATLQLLRLAVGCWGSSTSSKVS